MSGKLRVFWVLFWHPRKGDGQMQSIMRFIFLFFLYIHLIRCTLLSFFPLFKIWIKFCRDFHLYFRFRWLWTSGCTTTWIQLCQCMRIALTCVHLRASPLIYRTAVRLTNKVGGRILPSNIQKPSHMNYIVLRLTISQCP